MVYFLPRPLREYQLSRSKYYMTNKANIALTALSLAVSFPVLQSTLYRQKSAQRYGLPTLKLMK